MENETEKKAAPLSISAKVIACTSREVHGVVTSVEVTMPKYLQAEINTHRILSKSAMSSRAVPTAKIIEQVATDPFIPRRFGLNRKGMQPLRALEGVEHQAAVKRWREAADIAVFQARQLVELGVHKEHVNRILEPFMWTRCLITGSSWSNFIALRTSPKSTEEAHMAGAAYDMQDVADAIEAALRAAKPKESMYHTPYVRQDAPEATSFEQLFLVSAARCARISFRPYDGATDFASDLEKAKELHKAGHWGPFDHPAVAGTDNQFNRRFIPYRVWTGGMEDYSKIRSIAHSPVIFGNG